MPTNNDTFSAEDWSATLIIPKPNVNIWIADNVQISCNANYTWWNKLWAKWLLGWRVENIKND